MFKFAPPPAIKTALIATTLALSAFSINAHATLTSYTANGKDLVYSSVSNVTWTKDANLLGSLFASQGFNTMVNAIIAASPTIITNPGIVEGYHFDENGDYVYYKEYFDGNYTITANDYSSNGRTSWFGAMAYVNYLNSINYGGSNQWYLPTVATVQFGYSTATNGTTKGDELVELYYQELGSKAFPATGYGIKDPSNTFTNEQSYIYWSGTEYAPLSNPAWYFVTSLGYQHYNLKYGRFYAWAVSPRQISAVPEPESVAMLLLGLGVAAGVVRRRRA